MSFSLSSWSCLEIVVNDTRLPDTRLPTNCLENSRWQLEKPTPNEELLLFIIPER
jgi:hypothetical protein